MLLAVSHILHCITVIILLQVAAVPVPVGGCKWALSIAPLSLPCGNMKSAHFMPQDWFLIGKSAVDRDDKPTCSNWSSDEWI